MGLTALFSARGRGAGGLIRRAQLSAWRSLTSSKAFSDRAAITGDEFLATAILGRLLRHCPVLSIKGPAEGSWTVPHPTGAADAIVRPPRERHVRPYSYRDISD